MAGADGMARLRAWAGEAKLSPEDERDAPAVAEALLREVSRKPQPDHALALGVLASLPERVSPGAATLLVRAVGKAFRRETSTLQRDADPQRLVRFVVTVSLALGDGPLLAGEALAEAVQAEARGSEGALAVCLAQLLPDAAEAADDAPSAPLPYEIAPLIDRLALLACASGASDAELIDARDAVVSALTQVAPGHRAQVEARLRGAFERAVRAVRDPAQLRSVALAFGPFLADGELAAHPVAELLAPWVAQRRDVAAPGASAPTERTQLLDTLLDRLEQDEDRLPRILRRPALALALVDRLEERLTKASHSLGILRGVDRFTEALHEKLSKFDRRFGLLSRLLDDTGALRLGSFFDFSEFGSFNLGRLSLVLPDPGAGAGSSDAFGGLGSDMSFGGFGGMGGMGGMGGFGSLPPGFAGGAGGGLAALAGLGKLPAALQGLVKSGKLSPAALSALLRGGGGLGGAFRSLGGLGSVPRAGLRGSFGGSSYSGGSLSSFLRAPGGFRHLALGLAGGRVPTQFSAGFAMPSAPRGGLLMPAIGRSAFQFQRFAPSMRGSAGGLPAWSLPAGLRGSFAAPGSRGFSLGNFGGLRGGSFGLPRGMAQPSFGGNRGGAFGGAGGFGSGGFGSLPPSLRMALTSGRIPNLPSFRGSGGGLSFARGLPTMAGFHDLRLDGFGRPRLQSGGSPLSFLAGLSGMNLGSGGARFGSSPRLSMPSGFAMPRLHPSQMSSGPRLGGLNLGGMNLGSMRGLTAFGQDLRLPGGSMPLFPGAGLRWKAPAWNASPVSGSMARWSMPPQLLRALSQGGFGGFGGLGGGGRLAGSTMGLPGGFTQGFGHGFSGFTPQGGGALGVGGLGQNASAWRALLPSLGSGRLPLSFGAHGLPSFPTGLGGGFPNLRGAPRLSTPRLSGASGSAPWRLGNLGGLSSLAWAGLPSMSGGMGRMPAWGSGGFQLPRFAAGPQGSALRGLIGPGGLQRPGRLMHGGRSLAGWSGASGFGGGFSGSSRGGFPAFSGGFPASFGGGFPGAFGGGFPGAFGGGFPASFGGGFPASFGGGFGGGFPGSFRGGGFPASFGGGFPASFGGGGRGFYQRGGFPGSFGRQGTSFHPGRFAHTRGIPDRGFGGGFGQPTFALGGGFGASSGFGGFPGFGSSGFGGLTGGGFRPGARMPSARFPAGAFRGSPGGGAAFGFPGSFGGFPGSFGGFPGSFGGFPGSFGGFPGSFGGLPRGASGSFRGSPGSFRGGFPSGAGSSGFAPSASFGLPSLAGFPSFGFPSQGGSFKGGYPSFGPSFRPGSGSFPTGSFPAGSFGSFPTGSFPTGSFPTGSFPTGSFPTGSFPTGSLPAFRGLGSFSGFGSFPAGSTPSFGGFQGSFPTGSFPGLGGFPMGSFPASRGFPSGGFPGFGGATPGSFRGFPAGSLPSFGGFPGGSFPTGSFPTGSGSFPAGAFPTGAFPTGAFPAGSFPPAMLGRATPGGSQWALPRMVHAVGFSGFAGVSGQPPVGGRPRAGAAPTWNMANLAGAPRGQQRATAGALPTFGAMPSDGFPYLGAQSFGRQALTMAGVAQSTPAPFRGQGGFSTSGLPLFGPSSFGAQSLGLPAAQSQNPERFAERGYLAGGFLPSHLPFLPGQRPLGGALPKRPPTEAELFTAGPITWPAAPLFHDKLPGNIGALPRMFAGLSSPAMPSMGLTPPPLLSGIGATGFSAMSGVLPGAPVTSKERAFHTLARLAGGEAKHRISNLDLRALQSQLQNSEGPGGPRSSGFRLAQAKTRRPQTHPFQQSTASPGADLSRHLMGQPTSNRIGQSAMGLGSYDAVGLDRSGDAGGVTPGGWRGLAAHELVRPARGLRDGVGAQRGPSGWSEPRSPLDLASGLDTSPRIVPGLARSAHSTLPDRGQGTVVERGTSRARTPSAQPLGSGARLLSGIAQHGAPQLGMAAAAPAGQLARPAVQESAPPSFGGAPSWQHLARNQLEGQSPVFGFGVGDRGNAPGARQSAAPLSRQDLGQAFGLEPSLGSFPLAGRAGQRQRGGISLSGFGQGDHFGGRLSGLGPVGLGGSRVSALSPNAEPAMLRRLEHSAPERGGPAWSGRIAGPGSIVGGRRAVPGFAPGTAPQGLGQGWGPGALADSSGGFASRIAGRSPAASGSLARTRAAQRTGTASAPGAFAATSLRGPQQAPREEMGTTQAPRPMATPRSVDMTQVERSTAFTQAAPRPASVAAEAAARARVEGESQRVAGQAGKPDTLLRKSSWVKDIDPGGQDTGQQAQSRETSSETAHMPQPPRDLSLLVSELHAQIKRQLQLEQERLGSE